MGVEFEFKDVTPDGTPQTYEAEIGCVRLTVTRHSMGYEPDRWIAIPSLIGTPKLLQSKDIEEAKAEALELLLGRCNAIVLQIAIAQLRGENHG